MGRRGKGKNLLLIFLDFVLTLNLLSIPFYLLLHFDVEIQFLKNMQAFLVSKLLSFSGLSSIAEENFIIVDGKVYEVSWDSTGWKSLYTLFALIVSTPILHKRKIKPLAIALLLMFLFNIIRIFTTIYFSHKELYSFDFLHLGLWRWGSIGFLLFLWLIFLYTKKDNIGESKNIIGFIYGRGKP